MTEETTWEERERKRRRREEVEEESGEDRGTGPGQSIAPTSTHYHCFASPSISQPWSTSITGSILLLVKSVCYSD